MKCKVASLLLNTIKQNRLWRRSPKNAEVKITSPHHFGMKWLSCFGFLLLLTWTHLFANDLSQNIILKNAQTSFEISLTGNATTGYQWFLKDYNYNLLKLESTRYLPDSSKRIGAGGHTIFTFDVDPHFYQGPQSTSLHFVYERPWENAPTALRATIIVISPALHPHSTQTSPPSVDTLMQASPAPAITSSAPALAPSAVSPADSLTAPPPTAVTPATVSIRNSPTALTSPSPPAQQTQNTWLSLPAAHS